MGDVVIGMDPSSKKLAAVITHNDTDLRVWVRSLNWQDINIRCAKAHRMFLTMMESVIERYPDSRVHVFIEEPVVGRGGAYATISQAKVHGAVVAAAAGIQGDITVRSVNNSRAKKAVVGSGAAKKPQIASWCLRYWRNAYNAARGDQDIIDSAMINRYGAGIVAKMDKVEAYRQRATPRRRRTH